MKTIASLFAISLTLGSLFATPQEQDGSSATLQARKVNVTVSEQPVVPGSQVSRTLRAQAVEYGRTQAVTVSWRKVGGTLELATPTSTGSLLDLPKGFKSESKSLGNHRWLLGTYKKQADDYQLILTLDSE